MEQNQSLEQIVAYMVNKYFDKEVKNPNEEE